MQDLEQEADAELVRHPLKDQMEQVQAACATFRICIALRLHALHLHAL